jgi:hypothetical protein
VNVWVLVKVPLVSVTVNVLVLMVAVVELPVADV